MYPRLVAPISVHEAAEVLQVVPLLGMVALTSLMILRIEVAEGTDQAE